MNLTAKAFQSVTAGAGFLAGYLWAVTRWANSALGGMDAVLIRSSVLWGISLATVYAGLLAGLFWPWIPGHQRGGLRMALGPTAFTLSFVLGALGIQGALWVLG